MTLRSQMLPIFQSYRPPSSASHHRTWDRALHRMTQLYQPHPTHYIVESLRLSRIDKGFTSFARSLLIRMRITATVLAAPDTLHYAQISDHAPIEFNFDSMPTQPGKMHPIPKQWCSSPLFSKQLKHLTDLILDDDMEPFHRLATHKILIREAANRTRDALCFRDDKGNETSRLVFESMARAIWFNNRSLAQKLIDHTAIGPSFLKIEHMQVSPIDPIAFEQAYRFEKSAHLKRTTTELRSQINATDSANERKQLKGRLQAARRKQTTWWKKAPKLKLFGLQLKNEDEQQPVVSDPGLVQEKLIEHWGPIAQPKEVEEGEIQKVLGVYGRRLGIEIKNSFSALTAPDEEDIEDSIKHAKNSAPGRDGIPACAWRADPTTAAKTIHPCSDKMTRAKAPVGFNDSDVIFAPKGKEEGDKSCLTRAPGNLRTIYLLDVCNKIVSGAVNQKLVPPTLACTPTNQRGFCKGRQFALNIVVLDAFARVMNAVAKVPGGGYPNFGRLGKGFRTPGWAQTWGGV